MPLCADEDRADVAAVLDGDTDAFARLVDRHQGRIIAHCARLAGRDEGEDLAQETFLRAYQALGRYDPTYPFRGWLLVIASRLAANRLARRRERPAGDRLPEAESGDDPLRQMAEREAETALLERLDAALAGLPPEAQALYELRFRQDLPLDALAAHFATSVGTMKVRVHRLRQNLARSLGLETGESHA